MTTAQTLSTTTPLRTVKLVRRVKLRLSSTPVTTSTQFARYARPVTIHQEVPELAQDAQRGST